MSVAEKDDLRGYQRGKMRDVNVTVYQDKAVSKGEGCRDRALAPRGQVGPRFEREAEDVEWGV
jgi:hypothetical protein